MLRDAKITTGPLRVAGAATAGPYPALSGISAAADNANVAGNNPAVMTRFDSRNVRVELLGFFSNNTWVGQIGSGPSFTSNDTGTTIIPSSNVVLPLKNDWFFGFTILGSGFSEKPATASKISDNLQHAGLTARDSANWRAELVAGPLFRRCRIGMDIASNVVATCSSSQKLEAWKFE